jgi:hypothetical protein
MKKVLSLSMAIVLIAVLFSSCKKGENDPFLSLKSRTSRLSREWKMSSADMTTTYTTSSYTSTTTTSFDGTTITQTSVYTVGGSSSSNTTTYTFSNEVEFAKDGTFTETIIDDGDSETNSGIWSWVYGNEDIDLKNKEAIVLTYTSGDGYTLSGISLDPDVIYAFEKLSSSELVIVHDYSANYDGDVETTTGTMTFTAK